MLVNGKQSNFSAKSSTRTSLEEDDSYCEKFNWLISLQHARGEISACKDLIKKEINRSRGNNEFAYFKQGQILRQEKRHQEALECFQVCIKLNPDNVEYMKEVGKALYEMKRYKLSVETYLQAETLSKSPDWQIYFCLGQCFLMLGDLHRAKEYTQKAVKVGKHEKCYALLMKILLLEGDIKSAVAVSNAAVEACPDSVDMLRESGMLFLKLGQNLQAFERLSAALALYPSNSKVLLAIGYITQNHEEYDVALSKYKMAFHNQSDSVALWNNIGICFYSQQKSVAAINYLKRSLWMQPLNWRTLYNLGLAHLRTSQPASAFTFACAAVNLRYDDADCFALLGATLMAMNDTKNAACAMKRATTLAPEDAVLIGNAALCCYLSGSTEDAVELLRSFEICVEKGTEGTQELLEVMHITDHLNDKLRNGKLESNLNEDHKDKVPNDSDRIEEDLV